MNITAILRQFKQFLDVNRGLAWISYSQQSEDLEILRRFNGKNVGFFVDVGAYDPVLYSNTNLFYQKGWTGLNIEPNPDNFEKFKKLRSKDVNLNIGISDTEQILTYYKFDSPAINTFDKEHAELWDKTTEYKIIDKIEVQTFPLVEVLNRYLPPNQQIDFMSIDCEGFDLKVLKSNNWLKFRPKLLLVEESIVENMSLENSEIYSFLKSVNYNLATITSGTMIYKSEN
jgi:FkbM family methyltransferase